jgi:hypothetical protein
MMNFSSFYLILFIIAIQIVNVSAIKNNVIFQTEALLSTQFSSFRTVNYLKISEGK